MRATTITCDRCRGGCGEGMATLTGAGSLHDLPPVDLCGACALALRSWLRGGPPVRVEDALDVVLSDARRAGFGVRRGEAGAVELVDPPPAPATHPALERASAAVLSRTKGALVKRIASLSTAPTGPEESTRCR